MFLHNISRAVRLPAAILPFLLFPLFAAHLHAAPVYKARVTEPKTLDFGGDVTQDTPFLLFDAYDKIPPPHDPNQVDRGSASARASQGNVGVKVRVETNRFTRDVSASAEFTFDDLVFSDPRGADPINVSLPLHLGGSFFGDGLKRVSVVVALAGVRHNGFYEDTPGVGGSGLLGGLPGSLVSINRTVSIPFEVPVNTPVSIRVGMGAQVFRGNGLVSADFGDSFGFVTGAPTFVVPDGVNVNSMQAGIVGNRFVAGVPAPGLLPLLGLGCLTALRCRRLRRG